MHALEGLFESRPMVFALKQGFFQVLEPHGVVTVTGIHFKASDDMALLKVFVFESVAGLFLEGLDLGLKVALFLLLLLVAFLEFQQVGVDFGFDAFLFQGIEDQTSDDGQGDH